MFARVGKRGSRAFAYFNLEHLSLPAKAAIAIVVLGAIAFTAVVLALDWFSDHPSSTAVLIFPIMALYISIAVVVIIALDWSVRAAARVLARRAAR